MQVVSQLPVSVALGQSLNPTTFGQGVTFTATVGASYGTPDGNVLFRDGTATLGTVALSGGSASLVTSALAGGSHSISATYLGSTNYQQADPKVEPHVVQPAATTLSITSAPNPSMLGQFVTFTATIGSASSGMTGTVTFSDTSTGTTLGSAGVVNGGTTFATSALGVGSHAIAAIYSGDINFAGSSASPRISSAT